MPTTTNYLDGWYSYLTGGLGYQPRITSGVRTAADNRRVGGATNSYHMSGRSLDLIPPSGVSMMQLERDLRRSGVPFVELLNEGDHLHVTFPSGSAPAGTGACEGNWFERQWCNFNAGVDILTGRRVNREGQTVYEAGASNAWSGLVETLAQPAVRVGIFILAIALIVGAIALMAANSKQVQQAATTALKAAL